MNINELRQELEKTYQVPGEQRMCNFFDGIAFCGVDERFCIFLAIQEYLELMSEEELHKECLTEPEIPNNTLLARQRLKRRTPKQLMAPALIEPEAEDDYQQYWRVYY